MGRDGIRGGVGGGRDGIRGGGGGGGERCLCLDVPNLGRFAEIFFKSLNLKKCSIQMMYMGMMGHQLRERQIL